MSELIHKSVLLDEVLEFLTPKSDAHILDVTAGGGGHFCAMLRHVGPRAHGTCWDQDPAAEARILKQTATLPADVYLKFVRKNFRDPPPPGENFDYILADLGISSFQLDDPSRGMSLFSERPADFRMDPEHGPDFGTWLASQSAEDLEFILLNYGEEERAKKLARAMKTWPSSAWSSAQEFARRIGETLHYRSPSRTHPATRVFQALRIAINDEMGALRALLEWAPRHLRPGGRLAIISFHSLEDRFVKKSFLGLATQGGFDILTQKPRVPSPQEEELNPRSRSAKLRILEKHKGA